MNKWHFEKMDRTGTLFVIEPSGERHIVRHCDMNSIAGRRLLERMSEALTVDAPGQTERVEIAPSAAANEVQPVYWMPPVRKRTDLKSPPTSEPYAMCVDSEKSTTSDTFVYIFSGGRWGDSSVLFAATASRLSTPSPVAPEPVAHDSTQAYREWLDRNGYRDTKERALAFQYGWRLCKKATPAEPVAPGGVPSGWQGGEEWEALAWALCAEECGEDACNDLIWEGGPVPEPWGDRWLKYEPEAKRMIALVRKHVPAPAVASGLTEALYVASRASIPARSQLWRDLREQGWLIVSTWIDEAGEGETEDFGELWSRIEGEIRRASGLILYAESGDFPLKGALIEVGMAIGMGKRVAVVLPGVDLEGRTMRPVGPWLKHPLVSTHADVHEARDALSTPSSVAPEPKRHDAPWRCPHCTATNTKPCPHSPEHWRDEVAREQTQRHTPAEPVAPGGVPAGFALVPIEPTEAMWDAGRDPVMFRDMKFYRPADAPIPAWQKNPDGKVELDQSKGTTAVHVWRAMIAAAPPAPASEAPREVVLPEQPGPVDAIDLPVCARLYYGGTPRRLYKRASVLPGPGEPLMFVSTAREYMKRRDAEWRAYGKQCAEAMKR